MHTYLTTVFYTILSETNLEKIYKDVVKDFQKRHENIAQRLVGTQWVSHSIDGFSFSINKFDPLRTGSYIELPEKLAAKKAIVNVQNDDKCFLWTILSALYPADKDAQRVSKYKSYEHKFDAALGGLEFPMNLQNIGTFVKKVNKLNLIEGGSSINVYYPENGVIRLLCDIEKNEKANHVELLYSKKMKKILTTVGSKTCGN